MVATDGVPNVPSKMSVKLRPALADVEGGTKVKVAKSKWIIERKVGGICRRTMRMAIVS
jgi:hypothetical protein